MCRSLSLSWARARLSPSLFAATHRGNKSFHPPCRPARHLADDDDALFSTLFVPHSTSSPSTHLQQHHHQQHNFSQTLFIFLPTLWQHAPWRVSRVTPLESSATFSSHKTDSPLFPDLRISSKTTHFPSWWSLSLSVRRSRMWRVGSSTVLRRTIYLDGGRDGEDTKDGGRTHASVQVTRPPRRQVRHSSLPCSRSLLAPREASQPPFLIPQLFSFTLASAPGRLRIPPFPSSRHAL